MRSEAVLDISKVSAWVDSVADQNRESLYRALDSWDSTLSETLITELEAAALGLSPSRLSEVSGELLLKAIDILNEDTYPMLAALTAGLLLIEKIS